MKTLIKLLASTMAIALVCFAFAACDEEIGSNSSTTPDNQVKATSYHSGKEYATADYKKAEESIEYEDNKAMTSLMKDISKGKYDNKVVEIEGINTTYGNSCGILEKNDDGTLVGAMYYLIDGVFPTDYPAKDAHIKLKGLVVRDDNTGARHLEVPKDQIEVIG